MTNTTVTLTSSSPTLTFYSDSNCAMADSTPTLLANFDQLIVYFRDTAPGAPSISAAVAGLPTGAQTQSVVAPSPYLTFSGTAPNQAVGECDTAVTIQTRSATGAVQVAGGLQIALGADIRIARPDARFSILEIKWGLIPDVALTQTVRDIVRLDVAKELTWTGRILDGNEALALGLVTRVAEDPLAAALELAREIASKSPDAIRSLPPGATAPP